MSAIDTTCAMLASSIVVEERQRGRAGDSAELGRRIAEVEATLKRFVADLLDADDELLERVGRFGYEQLAHGAEHLDEPLPAWEELAAWKRQSWMGEAAGLLGLEFDPQRISDARQA